MYQKWEPIGFLPFLKYSGIRTVDGIFYRIQIMTISMELRNCLKAVAKKETSLKIRNGLIFQKIKKKKEKINEIAQHCKACRL